MKLTIPEFKGLIREVISECITEVSPPGEKYERMIQHVKQSLRDAHPKWPEDKITGRAIATAWKRYKNNESIEQQPIQEYDEKQEIDLIKGLHLITKKLLDMHKGMDTEEHEEEHSEKVDEKKEKWVQKAVDPSHKGYCTPMTKPTCTPHRKALAKRFKKGLEEVLNECESYMIEHKVQHRSYKTVQDVPQDPENLRNPEVPQ